VSSFYKNKFIWVLLAAFVYQLPLHADDLKLNDGFYADYPATKPAEGKKAAQIKRGEYLAQMGDCLACHTNVADDGEPFAGGLPIATPFGTFYTPNITPDKKTGIGKWTETDFIRALKEGKNPKGQPYFPVFPYIYFSKITDPDARDLYTYFMNIPAVERENTPLPFPFNLPGARFSLFGWNLLFFYPENTPYQADPKQTAEWNRGQYIVDSLGHCSMCHTPMNPLAGSKTQYYLTGAFIDGFWAPNITKYGLETATHQEVVDVFAKNQLINNAGPIAGPMAEVNHNSLSYLTAEDQLAISKYIKTVTTKDPLGLPPSNDPPSLSRGRQVYLHACTICHQNGEMTAPRIGNGANWTMRLKESGLKALYKNAIDGYNSMPPKGACITCSENDIMSAVDYLLNESLSRSQWLDVEAKKLEARPKTGKAVYEEKCSACHNDGRLNAPKVGDETAWKSLISKNLDVLVQSTIDGDHHPKKACSDCTTRDVMEAIKYMIGESSAKGNYTLW
jgi:cytochrome c5